MVPRGVRRSTHSSCVSPRGPTSARHFRIATAASLRLRSDGDRAALARSVLRDASLVISWTRAIGSLSRLDHSAESEANRAAEPWRVPGTDLRFE
jgi:hypothetical protein